jgi:hypothetical protein
MYTDRPITLNDIGKIYNTKNEYFDNTDKKFNHSIRTTGFTNDVLANATSFTYLILHINL